MYEYEKSNNQNEKQELKYNIIKLCENIYYFLPTIEYTEIIF